MRHIYWNCCKLHSGYFKFFSFCRRESITLVLNRVTAINFDTRRLGQQYYGAIKFGDHELILKQQLWILLNKHPSKGIFCRCWINLYSKSLGRNLYKKTVKFIVLTIKFNSKSSPIKIMNAFSAPGFCWDSRSPQPVRFLMKFASVLKFVAHTPMAAHHDFHAGT